MYSQIELRNQANYTLLVSGGDLNLCRAYMPFQCHRYENGEIVEDYDWATPEERSKWNKYTWYLDETPGEEWHPTDVHSETTHNALVLLGYDCVNKYEYYDFEGKGEPFFARVVDHDEFKRIRSKGKIFNFMKNYGGGLRAAMEQLDLPESVAQALIDGYSQAFPHVITYQNAIIGRHREQGYVKNMYGRRYYLKDNTIAYKLANYNVQGTCADMMKETMIMCDEYLQKKQAKGYKTRMVMPVHDELQFESCPGEEFIINGLRKIMEYHQWHLVPIVADIEVTTTNWAEKVEVEW